MNTRLIGFRFPFQIERGGIRRTQGFDKIEENVRHLLSTKLNERVMLRNYGGGIHHHVQAPNDIALQALIKYEIEQALQTYLPEVRLVAPIDFQRQEADLVIAIDYIADPQDVIRRLELQLPE